jgi:hypothetical protein
MPEPLKIVGVGLNPQQQAAFDKQAALDSYRDNTALCFKLSEWARVAQVSGPRGVGSIVVQKSDLLGRLTYGGEKGPSETPCPVHKGKWSGMHFGWPGSVWRTVEGDTPAEVPAQLQEWWDAGCRCGRHKGSSCTTGWQPDEACGCVAPE